MTEPEPTKELVPQEQARARAERIRAGIRTFVATLNDIADAYRECDWETLGYDSWDQYVAQEFSEARLRLSTEDRRKAVETLRLTGGMSTRAIGSALGISEATVRRDLAGASNDAVQDQLVVGTDGKRYPARQREVERAEVIAVPFLDLVNVDPDTLSTPELKDYFRRLSMSTSELMDRIRQVDNHQVALVVELRRRGDDIPELKFVERLQPPLTEEEPNRIQVLEAEIKEAEERFEYLLDEKLSRIFELLLSEPDYGPYAPHPFLDAFPLVPVDQFILIAKSILRNGLHQPITLNHDQTVLVDGRIRYLACRAVGVEPHYQVLGPEYTEEMILNYIWSMNAVRQSLTPEQKAEALKRAAEYQDRLKKWD